MTRFPPIAVLVLTAACGATSIPEMTTEPTDGCTIFLSGGLTASGDQKCTVVVEGSLDAGVSIEIGASGASYGVLQFDATLPGSTFEAGTFATSGSSMFVKATTTVTQDSQTWEQSLHGSNPDTGAATLRVSATGSPSTSNGATSWPNSHGTLNATLPAVTATGASGSLSATITF